MHANKLITKTTNNLNRIKSVKYDTVAQEKKQKVQQKKRLGENTTLIDRKKQEMILVKKKILLLNGLTQKGIKRS